MKKIIAIVGMPGAGKSKAAAFFKEKGILVLRFGSVTDKGLEAQGLSVTTENEKKFREDLREKFGMAVYAEKMLPEIMEALKTNDIIVLDGLYSWEEYVYLKEKVTQLMLVCIYASPKVRYQRLATRLVRPLTQQQAQQRDVDEIEKLHKDGPIAMADYMIVNESSEEEFTTALTEFFQKQL